MQPFTRFPEDLERYKTVYIADQNDFLKEYQVERFRALSGGAVIRLEGMEDRDAVEQYRDCLLLIRKDQLPDLDAGEYFISNLIGLQVSSEKGELLGILTDVLELPAHDVYQIQKEGRELLIPAISDVIAEINLEDRTMTVRLPEGLSS